MLMFPGYCGHSRTLAITWNNSLFISWFVYFFETKLNIQMTHLERVRLFSHFKSGWNPIQRRSTLYSKMTKSLLSQQKRNKKWWKKPKVLRQVFNSSRTSQNDKWKVTTCRTGDAVEKVYFFGAFEAWSNNNNNADGFTRGWRIPG